MQVCSERERCARSTDIVGVPDFSGPSAPRGPVLLTTLAATDRAALRARIADRIVRDIALLDALDGDPDLESEPVEIDADLEATALEWLGIGAQRFNAGGVA